MARPVVLSNGELHVGINNYGEVHDFYFPYVGLENHSAGQSTRHRVGIWVDGQLSWLDGGDWMFSFSYPHHALIGHTVAKNEKIGIIVEFDDAVDAQHNAFMRNIHVINTRESPRDLRIFLHQAFVIGDAKSNTDTGQYIPSVDALLHYRGRRAFIISARDDQDEPFDQYTIGLYGIEGREGTYRDADDGELSMCAVEHGRVDSTLRFRTTLDAHSSRRFYYWIACGTSTREALAVNKQVIAQSVHKRFDDTAKWWREWLKPARPIVTKLPPEHRDLFLQSMMIMKSHIDKRGAVIASTDSGMLNYWRDAYAYCWPRDGAYVLWPLIRMGYREEPYRFFDFCRRALSPGGYLMHKYRADGALGSSWHPYLHEHGIVSPPIQEDETALVLFVFSQFYHVSGDAALLKEFYEPMVVPMANFLAHFIDKRTGLPKPSYDLWEEQFLTTTYTTAVTHAALLAAADLADLRKDSDSAVQWRAVADDIHEAAGKYLYNTEKGVFCKGISVTESGDIVTNETVDVSSVYGAFMFGLFPTDSEQTQRSIKTMLDTLKANSSDIALPRYEHDSYRRPDGTDRPNWWFVTTLWLAQYYLERDEHEEAEKILHWVRESAWSSGVLSEQVDPVSGKDMSVAPLIWSQAEYISTLLDTVTDK